MYNLKQKTKIFLIILLAAIFMLPIVSFASNEGMVIVDKEDGSYLIYLKDYLSTEFEFAFSNNKEETELSFNVSAKDKNDSSANNVAYIDSSIKNIDVEKTIFMWLKQNGKLKITAQEINLKDNVKETELKNIENISNIIAVELGEHELKNEKDENDVQVTVKIGSAKIVDQNYKELSYCLIPKEETQNSKNLYKLAEIINKNNFTDAYTQIKAAKEFITLYNSEIAKIFENNNWAKVENNEVLQPESAQNGEQFILFLLKNGKVTDAHFLTSFREEDEKIISEMIVSKLPVLGENNTLLIILVVQVVALIFVLIRIKTLRKSKEA